ncbi:MAG: NDP-sugar synthase [Methanomassiliicoccales archaeon]
MKKINQAVILAGGEGQRLRPLTNTRPKPLLPVLDRPCLEYVIESLARAGITDIFLTCSYRSSDIVDAVGNGEKLGVNIIYSFEEEPMGTAGAVKLLQDKLDERFIVASGDVLADVDITALVNFHDEKSAEATLALTEVSRPEEFGIVEIDELGKILRFKEKPAKEEIFSNLVNAGIYVLERGVLEEIPFEEKFDFSKNLFPKLLANGRGVYGYKISGLWKDIGRPFDLLEANLLMAQRINRQSEKAIYGAQIERDQGGNVEPLEDSFLGRDVRLGSTSRITSSVIGRESTIGERTEIIDSLILARCTIFEECMIEHCVVGEGCVIGPRVNISGCVLGDGVLVEGPLSLKDVVKEP